MTQAKEKSLTTPQLETDSIVLDLEQFDLCDLDSLKDTALGNILQKNISNGSGHSAYLKNPPL
ncbi:hypothetical protein VB712_00550 [Spirulina sp. CCNP1310]|uniref:hypothetical protein n=1 Tax=Spirulina sp. CCNP1310 TaxID=3110249 RepID=UPI002B20C635|nr:hypothetical protein [Spirulina sp. CCNP1310]MEA5417691.1 hypothetical protein [Spirulina sp. CCNP1310]